MEVDPGGPQASLGVELKLPGHLVAVVEIDGGLPAMCPGVVEGLGPVILVGGADPGGECHAGDDLVLAPGTDVEALVVTHVGVGGVQDAVLEELEVGDLVVALGIADAQLAAELAAVVGVLQLDVMALLRLEVGVAVVELAVGEVVDKGVELAGPWS